MKTNTGNAQTSANKPRLLVVKTSSLGDVVHALAAVDDAIAQGYEVDWVVEEAFAEVPLLHPGVNRILPIAWRRWRKRPIFYRQEMLEFWHMLRAQAYDVVLDSQGLLKSAAVAAMARGPAQGFSKHSAREPLSALFYTHKHDVERQQHAVTRQRQLFAQALGYPPPESTPSTIAPLQARKPQVVFLHGTTWQTKHWPESMWIELAKIVGAAGYEVLLTWGNDVEHSRAQRIGGATAAVVLPKSTITELANVFTSSALVIGVDSGLSHLSAALGVPTLGLFGPTNVELTGCLGSKAHSLQAKLACAPCLSAVCKNYHDEPLHWQQQEVSPPCFATLLPEQVWQQAQQLMESSPEAEADARSAKPVEVKEIESFANDKEGMH